MPTFDASHKANSCVDVSKHHVRRLIVFGRTSAVGLAIDLLTFALLMQLGLMPGWASRLSSTAAVTFVYFASVRRTFSYQGKFIFGLFGIYVAYQAVGIWLAAAGVVLLVKIGVPPLLAKLIILPLTFPANYVAMSLMTANRRGQSA